MSKNLIKIFVMILAIALVITGCSKPNIAERTMGEIKYVVDKNWEVTEGEDAVVIMISPEDGANDFGANIAITRNDDDENALMKEKDLQESLLTFIDQTSNMDDTEITSDAVMDEVKVLDETAASLEFSAKISGLEGKFIVYKVLKNNILYTFNYNSLIQDADKYVPVFEKFVKAVELA